jgi:hypothetical protein
MWKMRVEETLSDSLKPVHALAVAARKTLTPRERRFWKETHTRWPGVRFRRYSKIPVTPTGTVGTILSDRPSVWYAPFYHAKSKTMIVIDHRLEFPYRVYGQNRALYKRHGYTVLDFSEDFHCSLHVDESVWQEMMGMVGKAVL